MPVTIVETSEQDRHFVDSTYSVTSLRPKDQCSADLRQIRTKVDYFNHEIPRGIPKNPEIKRNSRFSTSCLHLKHEAH